MNSDNVLIAYVPTPHAGYLKLFRAYSGSVMYILGDEFIQEFPSLVRHLPGVKPWEVKKMIQALGIFSDVCILTPSNIDEVRNAYSINMSDEDVSRAFAKKYFSDSPVAFNGSWRLRWDWGSVVKNCKPTNEHHVSLKSLDRTFMRQAVSEAAHSPDWWRQIGAVFVKDGKSIIATYNKHLPNEQSAYHYGDPRSNFEVGEHIDCSLALHAEAGIVAEAARKGISMDGGDLYVSTFPCPICAGICSHTGIKRLFYMEGYSLVSGAESLEAKGVEIIRVEV